MDKTMMGDGTDPVDARPLTAGDARPPATWDAARERMEQAATSWLATVRPDGAPHLRPVLAVWLEGVAYACTGPATRKGRDLARGARCAIATGWSDLDLVVEGDAVRVTDEARLRRVADAFRSRYGWPVEARDGALVGADGAPTAGPPPYHVYAVRPAVAYGFGTADTLGATRWRF